jgi:7,8-dihydropterin-6-yl-methyl-4-(beta-D-ribofuranosyl)aminobenzene 5'-phosphate synthase
VTITKSDRTTKILFDAGVTPDGPVENMRRLELSRHDIDIIVLSHGHWDHTIGMDGLMTSWAGTRTSPFSSTPSSGAGPGSPSRGAIPIELPSTSKPALEGAGFEIVERRQPSFLLRYPGPENRRPPPRQDRTRQPTSVSLPGPPV